MTSVYLFDHRVRGVTAVLESLRLADHHAARDYASEVIRSGRSGTTRIDVYACSGDEMKIVGSITASSLRLASDAP